MHTPSFVTVLLTVFNGMPYLPDAVESILAQTMPHFQFLVVDNGSTDGSGEWLEAKKDPRLALHRLPATISRTDVLNMALGLVTTEFIAIIDADDLASPTRLAMQLDFLLQNPGVALVGSDVTIIDPSGAVTGHQRFALEHESLCNQLAVCNQFAHAACMFRTSAARNVGGYPVACPYAQDMGLWLAMIAAGERVASLPLLLASIRVHPRQETQNPAKKQLRNRDTVYLAEKTVALPGLSRAARQASLLRLGVALWLLGERKKGVATLWGAVRLAPLGLCTNPLLWARVRLVLQRRRKH